MKLKCLLDKTQKLTSSALSKDKVRSAHLTQQLDHKEESESVVDSVPETKKMKLSEYETLTNWHK